jgi:hypothetical protein
MNDRTLWVSPKRFQIIKSLEKKCHTSNLTGAFDYSLWEKGLRALLGYEQVEKMLCSPFEPYEVKVFWGVYNSKESKGIELSDEFRIAMSENSDFDEEEKYIQEKKAAK